MYKKNYAAGSLSPEIIEHRNQMYISIVIPAYNEERRIVRTLEAITAFLDRKSYGSEVIVVDDGSSDGTVAAVAAMSAKLPRIKIVRNDENMGKGHSVKRGVMEAEGDLIFFTDADLSTPIEALDSFLPEIREHDIVIGSRAIKGANIVLHEPVYREILGRIFSLLVRSLCVPGFTDTQCGAKLFRREAAKAIFPRQRLSRFAFDVELLYLARLCGYKVKEIPVDWYYSTDTRVRPFRDGIKMLFDLIRIRFMHS